MEQQQLGDIGPQVRAGGSVGGWVGRGDTRVFVWGGLGMGTGKVEVRGVVVGAAAAGGYRALGERGGSVVKGPGEGLKGSAHLWCGWQLTPKLRDAKI